MDLTDPSHAAGIMEGGGWSTFKWLSYNLSFDSSLIASWIQSCPTSVCKQLPVPLSVGPDIHLSRRTDQAWRHALRERRHWLHLGVPTPLCVKGKKGGAVNSIALLIICWDSYNQMRPSSSSIIKKKTSHDPRIKLHHNPHFRLHEATLENCQPHSWFGEGFRRGFVFVTVYG